MGSKHVVRFLFSTSMEHYELSLVRSRREGKDVERCGKPLKSDSKLIHFVAFGHLRVLDLHLAHVQPCVLFLSRT